MQWTVWATLMVGFCGLFVASSRFWGPSVSSFFATDAGSVVMGLAIGVGIGVVGTLLSLVWLWRGWCNAIEQGVETHNL